MVESRVDKIESFVKELVGKVMLEAMDILDSNTEDTASDSSQFPVNCAYPASRQLNVRKNRSLSLRGARQDHERMKNTFPCKGNHDDCTDPSVLHRSPVPSANRRSHESNFTFDVDQRASEEIRKIVQGLQGVQIGDVSSVKPVTKIPILEREIKRAVQEMSRSNVISLAEGQGDVHDVDFEEATTVVEEVHVKDSSLPMFETLENSDEKDKDENQRQTQWQVQQQQEVSKLRSTCFLHRMIEELENAEASRENVLRVCASISGISQERIAAWEESEEKFIRTIEGSKHEAEAEGKFAENSLIIEEPFAVSLVDDKPTGCPVEAEIEELHSLPKTSALPPSSQATSQCAVVKKKSKSMQQQDTKLEKSTTKSKKSLGEKFRSFFRTTFKRSKDF